jgi:hypothetical protein
MSDATATIIAMLVLGPIFLYEKSFKAFLKIGNTIRGTKTEISKTTLFIGKLIGIFALVIGISGLLGLIFLK